MSLPTDAAPPGPLPAAATPPWPLQPPPHGAERSIPVRPREEPQGIGALGTVLIRGAAVAIGLAIALPLLFGRKTPAKRSRTPAKPRRRARKP